MTVVTGSSFDNHLVVGLLREMLLVPQAGAGQDANSARFSDLKAQNSFILSQLFTMQLAGPGPRRPTQSKRRNGRAGHQRNQAHGVPAIQIGTANMASAAGRSPVRKLVSNRRLDLAGFERRPARGKFLPTSPSKFVISYDYAQPPSSTSQ